MKFGGHWKAPLGGTSRGKEMQEPFNLTLGRNSVDQERMLHDDASSGNTGWELVMLGSTCTSGGGS